MFISGGCVITLNVAQSTDCAIYLHADTERRVELSLGDGEQVGWLERHRELDGSIIIVVWLDAWHGRAATSRGPAPGSWSLCGRVRSTAGGRGHGRDDERRLRSLVEPRRRRRRRRRPTRVCNDKTRSIDCDSYYWARSDTHASDEDLDARWARDSRDQWTDTPSDTRRQTERQTDSDKKTTRRKRWIGKLPRVTCITEYDLLQTTAILLIV